MATVRTGEDCRKLRLLRSAFALCAVLVAFVPALAVRWPPFLDYYTHIVRIVIAADVARYAEFYELNEQTPPNLGAELIIGSVYRLWPIETAGWLFVLLTILVLVTAAFALHRALCGRDSSPLGPVVACALVYNLVLQRGLLSYLLGLGLTLWGLAVWLRVRGDSPLWSVPVASMVALLIYFTHLVAFAVFALALVALEAAVTWEGRSVRRPLPDFLRVIAALVPPLLWQLLLVHQPGQRYIWLSEQFVLNKARQAFNFIDSGAIPPGIVLLGLGLYLILVLLLARVTIHRWTIPALALASAAFIAAPESIGEGYYLSPRLPLAIALLGLASLVVSFASIRTEAALLGVLLALLGGQASETTRDFLRFEERMQAVVRDIDRVPAGGTVVVMVDTSPRQYAVRRRCKRDCGTSPRLPRCARAPSSRRFRLSSRSTRSSSGPTTGRFTYGSARSPGGSSPTRSTACCRISRSRRRSGFARSTSPCSRPPGWPRKLPCAVTWSARATTSG